MKFTTISAFNAFLFMPFFEAEGGSGGNGGDNPPPAGDNPPPAGNDGPWFKQAGVADEHHEWLGSKQFQDLNTSLASHRHLETLVGRERLAVPKDGEDAPAYDAIFKALGRPEAADQYKLPEKTEITGEAFKWFQPLAHEAGLSQAQFDKIVTGFEAYGGDLTKAAETERANRENAETQALEKEWGSNMQANEDIASRAFRALSIDEAMSDKIEAAIGYSATMKLFHNIGSGMSEAKLLQDGNKGGGNNMGGDVMTLNNQLQDKFKDEAFMKRYMHADPRVRKGAIEEIEPLQKRIAELQSGGAA